MALRRRLRVERLGGRRGARETLEPRMGNLEEEEEEWRIDHSESLEELCPSSP